MKQLFPIRHIMGLVFSLFLTLITVATIISDIPYSTGMIMLLVMALVQSIVQLVLFMHVGETKEKKTLYTNILYAFFVGVVTIIGSWAVLIWAK